MSRLARFRTVIEMPNANNRSFTTHSRFDCRLCAAHWAMKLANQAATNARTDITRLVWKLERLTGAPDRWEIELTNRTRLGWLVKRHGH